MRRLHVCASRVIAYPTAFLPLQVRQGSFELLGVLLLADGFTVPPKGVASLLHALGGDGRSTHGVADPDGGTRAGAAGVYWAARGGCAGAAVDMAADRWCTNLHDTCSHVGVYHCTYTM